MVKKWIQKDHKNTKYCLKLDIKKFFDSVKRVLRPGGRLILQDYTAPAPILWLMNHTEMPLANLIGHGDVGAYSLKQIDAFCAKAGLKPEKLEIRYLEE